MSNESVTPDDVVNGWIKTLRAERDAERALADEWRKIATDLYNAIGDIEEHTPGGSLHWPASTQPAIDAYEYADDRYREAREQ